MLILPFSIVESGVIEEEPRSSRRKMILNLRLVNMIAMVVMFIAVVVASVGELSLLPAT